MKDTVARIIDVNGPHAGVIAKLDMPPSFVILDRVVWGVSALLGKLGLTAPWRAMLLEYRLGAPPATPLGELERAWRDARLTARRRADRHSVSCARSGDRYRCAGDTMGAPWQIRTRRDHRSLRGIVASCPGCSTSRRRARRVGHYKWAEMKLFEALGGWVATVPELDVKMRLGTHCYKHAWHAELWHKRLPELREMNPDRLTVPANDAMVRFVECLMEPEAPELTIEKLVGVYRVFIPHFVAAYTFHKNGTSQITDAPTIRSLQFILQDEMDDWRDGEMMIQSLLETPDDVRRAAARQAELELLMVEAGGIAGPGFDRRLDGGGAARRAATNGTRRTAARHDGWGHTMRKFFPVEELARDERFHQVTMRDRMADGRTLPARRRERASEEAQQQPAAAEPRATRAMRHGR